MDTLFLIGAGFSVPARYPTSAHINNKFLKTENRILKFSSSEWQWDDYSEVESHNGRLNSDHKRISYLLSDLVQYYLRGRGNFDYEDFYDYLQDETHSNQIKLYCELVNERLKSGGFGDYYCFKNPGYNEIKTVQECVNYLIADILQRPYEREKQADLYSRFINKINAIGEVDIFTLNHDLLIEFLFNREKIAYSDGFTTVGSEIVCEDKIVLSTFKNEFKNPIKLHKLHGSVNYYKFTELENKGVGNLFRSTNKEHFFKTNDYLHKHTAAIRDINTGEILQSLNPDITPQFITGKSKSKKINSSEIYRTQISTLQKCLKRCKNIIIIGYSFGDSHINELLLENNDRPFTITNINPRIKFPFEKEFKLSFVNNINSIVDV